MYHIIELEMDRFKEDFKSGLMVDESNNYLDVYDYEDEFSHNAISEAQYKLKQSIEEFLISKNINIFKVYYDWCVHVVDKRFYEEVINN